jgi:hypothetical protein
VALDVNVAPNLGNACKGEFNMGFNLQLSSDHLGTREEYENKTLGISSFVGGSLMNDLNPPHCRFYQNKKQIFTLANKRQHPCLQKCCLDHLKNFLSSHVFS